MKKPGMSNDTKDNLIGFLFVLFVIIMVFIVLIVNG